MTLKILPHGRLQEWVAEEQGYFAAAGLEYTFLPEGDYGAPAGQVATGAFETFGAGRGGADISCACHWATNAAAGQRAGRLVTTAYWVAPCAVMVPPESPVRGPADLAGVPVGVGYHSGSHFATVQAPEKYRHRVDVRAFGTGERIVFLPYTREVFAATQAWTRRVFPALPEPAPYDEAILLPAGTSDQKRRVVLAPFP